MPRAIWKGAVSFGLVSIPIRLFAATEEKDVSFRQVHSTDGGRVRYQRVCEKCGEVVAFADIAKGFEAADGRMAVLTDGDFAQLPLSTLKAVDVVQFVNEDEVVRNAGARIGDRLVLTKPLGFGILTTALKRELVSEEEIVAILQQGTADPARALVEAALRSGGRDNVTAVVVVYAV